VTTRGIKAKVGRQDVEISIKNADWAAPIFGVHRGKRPATPAGVPLCAAGRGHPRPGPGGWC
jgi:hypothetical protein